MTRHGRNLPPSGGRGSQYSGEQVPVPTAQVIRRLRDLEMPVSEVKAVLGAPDALTRNVRDEAEWRTEIGWPIFRADGSARTTRARATSAGATSA